jgi:hypothetical protein
MRVKLELHEGVWTNVQSRRAAARPEAPADPTSVCYEPIRDGHRVGRVPCRDKDHRSARPEVRQSSIAKLEKEAVPKDPQFNFDAVRQWWERASTSMRAPSTATRCTTRTGSTSSCRRRFLCTLVGLYEKEPEFSFPTKFRNGIVTFAPAADLRPHLGTLSIQSTVAIPTAEFHE